MPGNSQYPVSHHRSSDRRGGGPRLQSALPMMKTSQIALFSILLLGGFALFAPDARAEQVSREKDIVNLRLGQRIKVDDGTCPAGQIKEVSGAKMIANGVVHSQKCIPRLGPKIK
jgi:hypothetical protein